MSDIVSTRSGATPAIVSTGDSSEQLIIPISAPEDDGAPSYDVTVQGTWLFNESLADEVGTNDFSVSSGTVSYTQFTRYELLPNRLVTRSGLTFEENKSYTASNSYSYSANWTLAFWWYSPGLVGFTRHTITRELEPKVAPILAIADPVTADSSTVLTNATLVLTEIGYSKTQNAIRAYLTSDGTNISHVITSKPYSSGLHHVLVTYIPSQGRFRIDIDGETGILHSAPTGSMQKTGQLRINDVVPGYLAHKTIQTGGYLFDLVFTTYASTGNESLRAFRYGYEHITYEHLFDARFSYFGIAYSQPATISTSHIFAEGGNIFAARSNGKIVKGVRPVWDKEFDYPDTQAVTLLNISQTDEENDDGTDGDRTVKWTTSGLSVKGVSIRI